MQSAFQKFILSDEGNRAIAVRGVQGVMMEKVVLKATKRDVTGKQVKALRRAGQLPAVIYGRHVEHPISISLDAHVAEIAFAKVTSSTLVTIDVAGQEFAAIVREKQRNFIKGNLTHVDFLALDLTEKIRTKVRLSYVGSSLAVKDFSAVLVHRMDAVEVECLPTDLPERLTVDISSLKEIGNNIHVRDIIVPANVVLMNDPDDVLIVATLVKEEAPEVPAAVVGAVAEAVTPEISVERGKKEEAAAAPAAPAAKK
jgi:large subunit ribosomal protein L25